MNRTFALALMVLFTGILNDAISQLPANLEKELIKFNSNIYDALKIIDTQNERDAVAKLEEIKPELRKEAESLSGKLDLIPDLSDDEEEAWIQRMSEQQVIGDLMVLLSNPEFLRKIESSQALQKEFNELMAMMDLVTSMEEVEALPGSTACSFVVGPGSPNSGSYVVNAPEDQAIAYDDSENDQFVIEIHGDNYIDVIIILEKPVTGKHTFTMEMQVAIDISKNEGEEYFSFDNYLEEGGGYIQIDRLDGVGGIVSGSFSGQFNDSSTGDDTPVKIEGRFSVKRM
jgi:hypothetical protein